MKSPTYEEAIAYAGKAYRRYSDCALRAHETKRELGEEHELTQMMEDKLLRDMHETWAEQDMISHLFGVDVEKVNSDLIDAYIEGKAS